MCSNLHQCEYKSKWEALSLADVVVVSCCFGIRPYHFLRTQGWATNTLIKPSFCWTKLELSNVLFGFQDLRGVYLIAMYIPSINRYTCISYIYTQYICIYYILYIYIYTQYIYIYIYIYIYTYIYILVTHRDMCYHPHRIEVEVLAASSPQLRARVAMLDYKIQADPRDFGLGAHTTQKCVYIYIIYIEYLFRHICLLYIYVLYIPTI